MLTIEEARARDAKGKAAFYAGEAHNHPHGRSGWRFITAPEDDKRCMDTSAKGYAFSEWGNAAGHEITVAKTKRGAS